MADLHAHVTIYRVRPERPWHRCLRQRISRWLDHHVHWRSREAVWDWDASIEEQVDFETTPAAEVVFHDTAGNLRRCSGWRFAANVSPPPTLEGLFRDLAVPQPFTWPTYYEDHEDD